MEGAIFLGLAGIGYLLNKDKETKRVETNVRPDVFQNTNTSIYDLNNFKDSKNYEMSKVQSNFEQTLDPTTPMVSDFNAKSKEIPHKNDIFMVNSGISGNSSGTTGDESFIIGLDGNPISKEKFLMNDQGITVEPFYSGTPPTLNLDSNPNLDRTRGRTEYNIYGADTAQNLFSDLQFNESQRSDNVFGMADSGEAMAQDRYIPGMYNTNELPFEQERVPHIDQNSDINRDVGEIYAQRNNVDNLRTLSNQKMSFGGKVLGGKGVDERGIEGQVFKHNPDTHYEQNANQWLVTTGAINSQSIRPAQILPETNRQHLNRQEVGVPGSSINVSEPNRPMFKKTDRQQLDSDNVRNVFGKEYFSDYDHNKSSYQMYPNEREVTGERTHQSNVMNYVPGGTIQLQDDMKPCLKETTLNPASPNGFTDGLFKGPQERLYDSVKTSKKETVLYDHTGNASSSTTQEMAQDQYFRADLNPNKEQISRGRDPTPESVKLANGMDTINIDIKKIESDYFTHHQTGVDRVYQNIPTENSCEYTRDKDTLDNDKLAYRIEGDLLDPFKHNPYTHSLHSFAY